MTTGLPGVVSGRGIGGWRTVQPLSECADKQTGLLAMRTASPMSYIDLAAGECRSHRPARRSRSDATSPEEISMKRSVAALLLIALSTLAACNTVQGIGKDVERGGEKVQDTARDVQKKM